MSAQTCLHVCCRGSRYAILFASVTCLRQTLRYTTLLKYLDQHAMLYGQKRTDIVRSVRTWVVVFDFLVRHRFMNKRCPLARNFRWGLQHYALSIDVT